MPMRTNKAFATAIIAAISTFTLRADHAPRAVLPDAVVDLRTVEGAARVNGQWRYSDTHIQEIAHKSVGPDLKASGPANRTFDFTPDARGADFNDSKWEVIPADSLEKRRGNGRLSFNWYRLKITVPDKVGGFDTRGFDTRGSTVVFEIVVDDYAEVWVNGKALVEAYLNTTNGGMDDFGPVTVPPGNYFAMGDNRGNSYDSRYSGFVPRDAIVGSPATIYMSLDADPQIWLPGHLRERLGVYLSAIVHPSRVRWKRLFVTP